MQEASNPAQSTEKKASIGYKRLYCLTFACILFTCCLLGNTPTLLRERFLWKQQNIDDYQIQIKQNSQVFGVTYPRVILTVCNNKVVRVDCTSDFFSFEGSYCPISDPHTKFEKEVYAVENYQEYTVDNLFTWISPPSCHVDFDGTYHYPTNTRCNFSEGAGIQVSNFKLIDCAEIEKDAK